MKKGVRNQIPAFGEIRRGTIGPMIRLAHPVVGRRTAVHRLGSHIWVDGLPPRRVRRLSAAGASVPTEAPQVHGEQRHETDPTPELSERFNDGRPRAGDAAALARRGPGSVGPNDSVNLAVIGLGSTTAVGGVGGRGHQLIGRLREIKGVKIVALCDADQAHLDREVEAARDHGGKVTAYHDPRQVFDDKGVDAVIVALPNHWHALATVWACQAGKDVYVEKPFSYDLWEGQQMVAAARKYGRMVQVGTQNRSSTFLRRVFDRLRGGELGAIRFAHALVYRARDGIGSVDAPTPPPRTLDYDLWCGPAPKKPLMRKQLHYEWHWFWDTGNGEMGNNGIHVIDICRWALGQDRTPPRTMSIGGRLAFHDCGETANTHIALLDFQPAPLICEVRNVSAGKGAASMGKFRGQNKGVVIDCEGGYFAGDASGGAIFDRQGKKVHDLGEGDSPKALELAHLSAFLAAVRSRKATDLAAEALRDIAQPPAATWRTCLTGSENNHRPRPSEPRSRVTPRWPMPSSAAASICARTASTSTPPRPRSAPG